MAHDEPDAHVGRGKAQQRRNDGRVQMQLTREGSVQGRNVKLTKGVTLNAAEGTLEIAYLLENVPQDIALHLAPEFNFAGLPSGADDRYFSGGNGQRLGQLGHQLDLQGMTQLGLTDEWLGIGVTLTIVSVFAIIILLAAGGGIAAVVLMGNKDKNEGGGAGSGSTALAVPGKGVAIRTFSSVQPAGRPAGRGSSPAR